MSSVDDKARAFRALHEAPGCFVIPNPWDRGSARMLARLGYRALATTSAMSRTTARRRASACRTCTE